MGDEAPKRAAGYAAAGLIEDGMVVGLGTGSTVPPQWSGSPERIRDGLSCVGVPTSHQTAMRARALGIPLASLNDAPELALAIDGADQVDPLLRLIKGRGAAQTREKCIAAAAERLVIGSTRPNSPTASRSRSRSRCSRSPVRSSPAGSLRSGGTGACARRYRRTGRS